MQTDEIFQRVADRGRLAPHEASAAVRGTMLMLGRALPAEQAELTAAQLPTELADHLQAAGASSPEVDGDALVTKAAETMEVDGPTARERVGVVLGVLPEALDEGAWTELTRHLPSTVTDLLPA